MQKLLTLFFILCAAASSAQDIRDRDSLFLSDLYAKFSDTEYFPSCPDLNNSTDFKIDSTLQSFYNSGSHPLSALHLSPTRQYQIVEYINEMENKRDSLEKEILIMIK